MLRIRSRDPTFKQRPGLKAKVRVQIRSQGPQYKDLDQQMYPGGGVEAGGRSSESEYQNIVIHKLVQI